MGKFKEMEIEAQDAVIADYDTMYEIMPKNEPTNVDLMRMQQKEAILLTKTAKTLLEGMIYRYEYYDADYKTSDIETVIETLKDLKRTLE
jgi:hypothetical protein